VRKCLEEKPQIKHIAIDLPHLPEVSNMIKVKEYSDPKNVISYAYAISRNEWEELKKGV